MNVVFVVVTRPSPHFPAARVARPAPVQTATDESRQTFGCPCC